MSSLPRPRISVEEYLRLDRAAEFKSEYFDGRMYPLGEWIAPPPDNPVTRAIILANFAAELRAALRRRGFSVGVNLPSADIAIFDQAGDQVLLVEIPSPSAEVYVRGKKTARHRETTFVREYALVSHTEPLVEVYTRQSKGWLISDFAGLDATCRFPGMDCEIAMSEIYLGVDLPADPSFT